MAECNHKLLVARNQLRTIRKDCKNAEKKLEDITKWRDAEESLALSDQAAASAMRDADTIRIEHANSSLKLVILENELAEINKSVAEITARMTAQSRVELSTQSKRQTAKKQADRIKTQVENNQAQNANVLKVAAANTEAHVHAQLHINKASSFMQNYNAAHAAAYNQSCKRTAACRV